jgi:SAM-dependent methyltransferase
MKPLDISLKFWSLAAVGILTVILVSNSYQGRKEVFENVYRNKEWGVNSSEVGHSGIGSTMENTKIYRFFLQDFLAAKKIHSVVDAGCGDWEFSKSIDWSGINYSGYDIVESLIAENKKRYGASNIHFFACDIVNTQLPPADLLIVKDVLQHLPNKDILGFLKQLPKYKHVLITNGVDTRSLSAKNEPDIAAGGRYRPLDLTLPPFSLPMVKILAWANGGDAKLVLYQENEK